MVYIGTWYIIKNNYFCRSTHQTSTPGSARKVMLGLERGLNRVRYVLTPKRRVKNENTDPDEPNILSGKVCGIARKIIYEYFIIKNCIYTDTSINFTLFSKGLSNVSSTCSACPKYVLSKLRRALRRKGIMCRQKG